MKLKLQISLAFGSVVLAALLIVISIYSNVNVQTARERVYIGMETAGEIASKQLSEQLNLYCNMVKVAGTDPVLSSDAGDKALGTRINVLATGYNFTSGNVLDKRGVSLKDGTDFSDREYVQKALEGKVNISDITLSKLTGKYGFSVAGPLYNETGKIKGVIYFRMDVDFMHEILNRIKPSENGYAFLVNENGLVIVHPNNELIGQVNIKDGNNELAMVAESIARGESGRTRYDYNGEAMEAVYEPITGTNGWGLVIVVPTSDYMDGIKDTIFKLIYVDLLIWIATLAVAITFAARISNKTNRVVEVMKKLSVGDFSGELKPSKGKDEIAMLQNATCKLKDTFVGIVKEESRVLGGICNFDLTQPDISGYEGEFNKLTDSVNQIKKMLAELIKQIQIAASEVNVGSGEIAKATEHLSQGTTTQAMSIEQMMGDVQDIADRIGASAKNEANVEASIHNLEQLIHEGNEDMVELFRIVKEVEQMSNDIQNIIKLIDSIAFQTNILALNASVEAARAGESGRGFAVVADEIGNLAEKASDASKQTADLIENCIRGIRKADASANNTSECLNKIVEHSREIDQAFTEIAEDTRQQAERSANIKEAIHSISNVVQTNTATAQQTAAATEELSGQSESMSRMVQRFKL